MISASRDSVLAEEYGYDAFGRRVWRQTHGTGAVHIHYIFDPDGHLLAEHDAATGDVLREYVWLEDTPLAMFDYSGGSAATFFIHTGQIGEPLAVTNAARAKVWDAAIEPFGQAVMFATASEALDLRLPGQLAQAETGGLFQNWMRDYDPTLGRYAQADPLGIDSAEHSYQYVESDPLNQVDPSGLYAMPSFAGSVRALGPRAPAIGAVGALAQLGRVAVGAANLLSQDPEMAGRRCRSSRVPSIAVPMPSFDDDECADQERKDRTTCALLRAAYGARKAAICHGTATTRNSECVRGGGVHAIRTPLYLGN